MADYKNILVLKWGALGDFIAGTVAIRALREHFSPARLTLLSNPNGLEICPAGSLVDAVHDRKALLNAHGPLGLIKFLRSHRYDLAVNLKWASEGAALVTWLSAPTTAGSGKRLVRRLYTYRPPVHAEGEYRHEYHKNRDIVEALGVPPAPPSAYLYLGPEDHLFADAFFAQHGLVQHRTLLIAPGASRPGKTWPQERFAEIGRRFVREHGGRVLVSWGPKDEPIARAVAAGIGDGAVLCPRTSVRQIGALVARSGLVLCNNSGLMHVAYAVGTRVVCLNTAVSWAPYGDRNVGVNAFAREHLERLPLLGPLDSARALDQISVAETWDALVAAGFR